MATPLCRYFGSCGGCTSQHIEYEAQLEYKRKLVAAATGAEVRVFSGPAYAYRNRMDFAFHAGGLGLRERNNWKRIIDIAECPISEPRVNALLTEVRERCSDRAFRYAVLRAADDTCVSFVLDEDAQGKEECVAAIRDYAKASTADHVVVAFSEDTSVSQEWLAVKGTGILTARILGRPFRFSSQGFFQNNTAMAESMVTYVRELLGSNPGATLLDLYGGVGLFGVSCADLFRETHIVESAPEAAVAKENIARGGVNAQFHGIDARQLGRLRLPKPVHVIADPPRSGMEPAALHALRSLEPERIIYISCNPRQLKKDIPKLRMTVKNAALFDLFPQTPHIEAVVELCRTTP